MQISLLGASFILFREAVEWGFVQFLSSLYFVFTISAYDMDMLHAVPFNTNVLETLAMDGCILCFQIFRRHNSNPNCSASKPKRIYTGYII